MRRTLWLTILAIAIAFPAAAADNGFYFGGSVGRGAINTGNIGEVSINGDSTAWKGFAGFRFLHFVAVEGAYADLGTVKLTDNEAKVKAYHAEAVGLLPLGLIDIFGKAGLASWKSDFSGPATAGTSKSGTDPVYGAGVQFRINSWAVRGEVEYFDIKDANHVYMYSIGASYTF